MTTNHIDQLTEWWENAEKGAPSKGDAIIRRTERLLSNGYAYEVGTEDYTDAKHLDNVRILARAPKPKPAWHDAVAVMAVTPGRPERRVSIRDDEPGWWGDADSSYETDELAHVTPLIEAKVTDGMVLNYLNHSWGAEERGADAFEAAEVHATRNALTAALGLETT